MVSFTQKKSHMLAQQLKEAEQDLLAIQQKSRTNKSLKATYEMLYKTRMLKYVRKDQFIKIRKTYGRFTSQKNLDFLCQKGWLEDRIRILVRYRIEYLIRL